MNLQESKYGNLSDGREVKLFTLSNDNNVKIKITNYGGIITSIETPDKSGSSTNIVCGFDKLEDYLSDQYLGSYPFFGCLIGRFGNRIAKGDLTIEGKNYKLAINNAPSHLHGGPGGFDRRLWDVEPFEEKDKVGVKLTYLSPHLEENYPGNLEVTCIYSLNNENELKIEYFATTDKTTVVNLTNHSYFNLTGGKDNILNHELMLTATKMTESVELIPTGKIIDVKDTPFDFTTSKAISKDIGALPNGYDDNFILDNDAGEMKYIACISEASTGRKVEVYTTQPGVQFYTGYWIPELIIDGEKKFGRFTGLALETQHYPDSVHHSHFPTTILKPGETYNETTIYKFGL